jgi:hypothetical protein
VLRGLRGQGVAGLQIPDDSADRAGHDEQHGGREEQAPAVHAARSGPKPVADPDATLGVHVRRIGGDREPVMNAV